MNAVLLIGGVAAVAAVATWLVRHYAIEKSLIDVPNERSSHSEPTPRGGGIGIFVALLAGLCAAYAFGWLEQRLFFALATGGMLVGGIGFVDDHRHVRASVRAAVHFIAALIALALLGGLPSLRFGASELALGAAGWVLAALGIVWLINLYNFMDGIDGLAASEALVVCSIGAMLASLTGTASVATAAAVVAAAAAGFLVWNWPPAKIFMGDVGSGLLGYCIAVVAVGSENSGGPPLLVWLVLGAVFFVDTTLTLVRRVLHGEKWFKAHRLHAYQRAVRAGLSHGAVTGAVAGLNVLLGAIAYFMVEDTRRAPILLVGALVLVLAFYVAVERVRPMYLDAATERVESAS
ncbi:MAG: MraY family glycosyltransferase [Longimicrobiales bacterium]